MKVCFDSLVTADTVRSYVMLGSRISPLCIDELNELVGRSIRERSRLVIASCNLHALYSFHRNAAMRQLHRNAVVRIDGVPVVWLARLFGYPVNADQRVTWVDWIHPLSEVAARNGWRVFYLGSRADVLEAGLSVLRDRHANLTVCGHHGYFDHNPASRGSSRVIQIINSFEPDILIVGLGMPLQEEWVARFAKDVNAPVILVAGAAIEYVAGAAMTPPRWLGRIGLEWAFRLVGNPRRFWKRYLVEPWFIGKLVVRDAWKKYVARMPLNVRTD